MSDACKNITFVNCKGDKGLQMTENLRNQDIKWDILKQGGLKIE